MVILISYFTQFRSSGRVSSEQSRLFRKLHQSTRWSRNIRVLVDWPSKTCPKSEKLIIPVEIWERFGYAEKHVARTCKIPAKEHTRRIGYVGIGIMYFFSSLSGQLYALFKQPEWQYFAEICCKQQYKVTISFFFTLKMPKLVYI